MHNYFVMCAWNVFTIVHHVILVVTFNIDLIIHTGSAVPSCYNPEPPNTGLDNASLPNTPRPHLLPLSSTQPLLTIASLQTPPLPSLSSSQPPLTIASPPNTPPLPPPGQPVTRCMPPILKSTFVDTGGATSFASQNPLKDIQPPRVRVHNSKSDTIKLGQVAKIAARSQKAEELKIGVDAIVKSCDREIKDLLVQLNVSEHSIQKLVNGQTHYKHIFKSNVSFAKAKTTLLFALCKR